MSNIKSLINQTEGRVVATVSNSKDFPLKLSSNFSVVDGFHEEGSRVSEDGTVVADPEFTKQKKDRDLLEAFRVKRNALLSASDWTQVPDAPVDQQAWATYRQELRDLPDNTEDPRNPVWPTKPS